MNLLLGALTLGFILSLVGLGVWVSFRIFKVADITVDGSLTFGAAVTAALVVGNGTNPLAATLAGMLAGMLAGTVTGLLQTRFKIDPLLSGILVMTALYSVNLRVMGRSNVPFLGKPSLQTWCEELGRAVLGAPSVDVFGWPVAAGDLAVVTLAGLAAVLVGSVLWWFFRTDLGTAMRASGDNAQMIRALGADVERYRILGLALSNGLVALGGSLLAQYQGFADAQMGIGMVVWGLASVIIGEALTGAPSLGFSIVGTIMGSVFFRELVAIALGFGLNPNDLKLVTAAFVFAALVLPSLLGRGRAQEVRP
ncbi:ABC transporter permease [bacterium]|nr:ABC transporter permease [bacterium]